ncbi:MAG: hypothetical protein WB952_08995 [Terriglobales bacterium]
MNSLPQLYSQQRSPRVQLADATPAVLRFQDGHRTSGKLQVVSLTGGLLVLPNPLDQGSQVKLMFLTRTGSVLGAAEMLDPLSSSLQPFRFVALPVQDQRRLGTIIRSTLGSTTEQEWIEKLRAAANATPQRGRLFKMLMGAAGIVSLGVAGAMYFHVLK